jgi:hypothetical protein
MMRARNVYKRVHFVGLQNLLLKVDKWLSIALKKVVNTVDLLVGSRHPDK